MNRIEPIRLAILISGGGRTMLNLHDRIKEGTLCATIEVVISSRASARGVERARAVGVPTIVIERKTMSDEAFDRAITEAVDDVDLVCMGGFLSLWRIPDRFAGRVLNIHPALLPEFGGQGMYGLRVHQAVLAAGRTQSGCTVHVCDNDYDHGPIVLQRTVPVLADDTPETLAQRVFDAECIAYPEAITMFQKGRVKIKGTVVEILPAPRGDE